MKKPSREGDFRFFDLGLGSRLALSALLYFGGGALGVYLGGVFPGIILAILGWLPLMVRPATNKPDDQGLEEWRPVTMAEFDRLDAALQDSKKIGKKMGRLPRGCLFALIYPPLFALLMVGAYMSEGDPVFFLWFAIVYLIPPIFFGRVKVFVPATIDKKLPSFRAVLAAPCPKGIALLPYFRFDKDPEGRDIPEDIRLMMEARNRPEDLVGIQLQAALNRGPNGEVPYLYAVVLTKGRSGEAYRRAERFQARGWTVESGGDGEYGTVVIRQNTAGGGYHTDAGACRELAGICYAFLESLALS